MQANSPPERYRSFLKLIGPTLCYNLGSCFFGFNSIYFNLIDFEKIHEVYSIDMEVKVAEGIYSGCWSFGAIFGSLLSSFLIERVSRRKNFYIANFISFIAGALILIENMYTLLLGRIIQGICTGIYSSVITLTVKEFSPVEASGSLGAIKLVMFNLGCVLPPFLAYFFDESAVSIKIFFSIIMIFPFLQQALLLLCFSFQTPKYYLMNGRIDQCRTFIQQFYRQEYWQDVLEEKVRDLEVQIGIVEEGEEVEEPKDNCKAIFIAFFMQLLMQLCGINIFGVYNRQIAVWLFPALTKGFPIAIQLVRFAAAVLASVLLKDFGRKTILIIGLITEVFLATCFWLLLHFGYQKEKISGLFILIFIFFIIMIYAFSISPICWLYIPEVIQPSLVPFTTLTNWVCASLFLTLYPIIFRTTADLEKVGIMITFGTLISAIIVQKIAIETKGKTELEIRTEFNEKSLC